jgi:hypothetical protein
LEISPKLARGELGGELGRLVLIFDTIKETLDPFEGGYEIGRKKGLGASFWSLKSRES